MNKALEQLSTDYLFKNGNYAQVALRGDTDNWQTFASLGLMGICDRAHGGLERFDNLEIPLYRSAIFWIEGKDQEALSILKKLDSDHAKNLISLIQKPRIQVLAQLSWSRSGSQDVLTGIQTDPKFDVRNISFHEDDLPNEPYADIRKYYDPANPPDFFHSEMVEWHITPPNIQQLPCPIFGQTSDYDIHIQQLHPWLQIFDEIVAGDHVEWLEVGGLAKDTPLSTFPKFVGVSDLLPPIPDEPRMLDFFVSGTVMHPYWPEKTKALHTLLSTSELEHRLIQGFLPQELYRHLLGSSKTCFSFLRHPAAMPSRALEALSMGCAVAVQDDSVLRLFAGEEEGLVSYGQDSLGDCLQRVVNQWDTFEHAAALGAKKIRDQFALSTVASQYFRFLTFLAAKPRPPRKNMSGRLLQKRMVISTGFLPPTGDQRTEIRKATLARCAPSIGPVNLPLHIIDITREILCWAVSPEVGDDFIETNPQLIDKILDIYRKNLQHFPKSLVLRFNFLRSLYYFGGDKFKEETVSLANEIISKGSEYWQLDVFEDVFAWDFFNTHFNYRSYNEIITNHLMSDDTAPGLVTELIQLILASVHHHLGLVMDDPKHHNLARKLDPDFAYYGLEYAKSILEKEPDEAAQILSTLSDGSIVFAQAFDLLEQLQMASRRSQDTFLKLFNTAKKLKQHTTDVNTIQSAVNDTFKRINLEYARLEPLACKLPTSSKRLVSVVLLELGKDKKDSAFALQSIKKQSTNDANEIIFCHDNPVVLDFIVNVCDRDINIKPILCGTNETSAALYNRVVEAAQGEYISFLEHGHFLKPDALELMTQALQEDEKATVAYCDLSILVVKSPKADNNGEDSYVLGHLRRPDFSKTALFDEMNFAPGFIWRKSIYSKTNNFDPLLKEDSLFGFMLKNGLEGKFVHIPKLLATLRIEHKKETIKINPPTSPTAVKIREELWPKGWGNKPEIKETRIIPENLIGPSTTAEATWLSGFGFATAKVVKSGIWYLSAAKELILRQDWIMAQIVLRTLIESASVFVSPHLILAQLHKYLNQDAEFEKVTEQAAALDPVGAALYTRLGAIKSARGDMEGAIESTQKACEALTPPLLAVSNLAALYYETGDFKASYENASKIIQKDPSDVEAWKLFGAVADKLKNKEDVFLANKKIETLSMLSRKGGL